MKRGFASGIVVLAMLIVALFFLQNGGLAGVIPTPTPTATPTATPTPVTPTPIVIRPDLAVLFYPYIAAFTPEAGCAANGGTWFNTPARVGCFDATIPFDMTVTCNTPAYQAAIYQCDAVGAISDCNWFDIGCYYA